MGTIRVYKQFYVIVKNDYSLISPSSITAISYNVTQGSSVVENNLTIINVSTGVYYAELSAELYNSSDEFRVEFTVKYTPTAPNKILPLTFKLDPSFAIANSVSLEIDQPLVYEINIDNNTLEF